MAKEKECMCKAFETFDKSIEVTNLLEDISDLQKAGINVKTRGFANQIRKFQEEVEELKHDCGIGKPDLINEVREKVWKDKTITRGDISKIERAVESPLHKYCEIELPQRKHIKELIPR